MRPPFCPMSSNTPDTTEEIAPQTDGATAGATGPSTQPTIVVPRYPTDLFERHFRNHVPPGILESIGLPTKPVAAKSVLAADGNSRYEPSAIDEQTCEFLAGLRESQLESLQLLLGRKSWYRTSILKLLSASPRAIQIAADMKQRRYLYEELLVRLRKLAQ